MMGFEAGTTAPGGSGPAGKTQNSRRFLG